MDGLGRRDRIRYDTPKFAGFGITSSHGNSDARDVALRYGSELGSVKIKAAVAWSDANLTETVNGSLSILLPVGLSFTIAGGQRDREDLLSIGRGSEDANFQYAKIGYKFTAMELGQTRLFASYGQFNDLRASGEQSATIAAGVVQLVEPLGIELQAGYARFSLEQPGLADPDDIDVITPGARVKF